MEFWLILVIVISISISIIVFLSRVIWDKTTYSGPITAERRGQYGENVVRKVIGATIENEQYVINDLILINEGKSSQIDHIVINPRGVFVIETKNYSGDIYGDENQREWTQVLAYGNVKEKLYNPLKQNATHVYNVKKIVGNLPVRSLVVFVQNNTRNVNAENVIPLFKLKSVLDTGESVISAEQMAKAYEALVAERTELSIEEHVENIKQRRQDLANGICPRCGGRLVLRNGKYGEFYGCSNYPKCKFKMKNDLKDCG